MKIIWKITFAVMILGGCVLAFLGSGESRYDYVARVTQINIEEYVKEVEWDLSSEYSLEAKFKVASTFWKEPKIQERSEIKKTRLFKLGVKSHLSSSMLDDLEAKKYTSIYGKSNENKWEFVFNEKDNIVWCKILFPDSSGDLP